MWTFKCMNNVIAKSGERKRFHKFPLLLCSYRWANSWWEYSMRNMNFSRLLTWIMSIYVALLQSSAMAKCLRAIKLDLSINQPCMRLSTKKLSSNFDQETIPEHRTHSIWANISPLDLKQITFKTSVHRAALCWKIISTALLLSTAIALNSTWTCNQLKTFENVQTDLKSYWRDLIFWNSFV